MHVVAAALRTDKKRSHGAVRLFLGRDGRELDHQVGFVDELLEHLGCVVLGGGVALEDLSRGEHDLVGSLAATAFAAHAVGHEGQGTARYPVVHQDLDLILLVGAVSAVHAGGRGQPITLGARSHPLTIRQRYGASA
jgi:hypothetical protein